MANSSVGTAWIQIKPTLAGISNDIKKELGAAVSSASNAFGSNFKSSFLLAAKQTFSEAFTEFGRRSDAAFSQFKTAMAIGFAAVTAGVIGFAKELDRASGSQKSFIANMTLAGISNEETARTFKLLQDYANRSIYSLTDMTSTAGILASTGVKNAGELVKAFGNMAAAADNPAQAIKSISQQMAQVNGKGFVQTMDFRIMQEQAAGPMKLVRDRIMELNKMDMAGFQDALSNGEISAKMLNEAILSVGSNSILNQLATKPRTIGDAWEALTSTLISNLATSESWARIQAKVVDMLVKAGEWISNNQEEIEGWINSVVDGTKAMAQWLIDNRELVKIILQVVIAYKSLQIAVGAYRSAMDTLTPFYKLAKGGFQLMIGGVQTLTGRFKDLGAASGNAKTAADGIKGMGDAANKAPKTFTFGDSISSFFKNIGKTLSGAADAVVQPIKTLTTGAGEAIAGFFKPFANPQLLLGVLVFTAAAGGIALSILMIGGAIGAASPALGAFMTDVVIPLGNFLVNSFVASLNAVAIAMIALTTVGIIPLVQTVSGGLTLAFNAIGGVIQKAGGAISGVVTSVASGVANVINSIANLLGSVGRQDWYGTGYGITRNFSAGLVDGLIDLLQDSMNKIINSMINVPGIGQALKAVGLQANPVNLKGFKLGRRANGGPVFGPGSATSDSIPMALSNGEYVIRAAAAQKIGYSNLDSLNASGSISGGDTYNVYPPAEFTGDYKILAQWISKYVALQKARVIG